MNRVAGVYMIQSVLKPERVYIGSSFNINERFIRHKNQLRKGNHHSKTLQRHYNKYGGGDLVFETIESGSYIDNNHLFSREQGWYFPFAYKNKDIPYFNSLSIAGSTRGKECSVKTRKIIGRLMKGNKYGCNGKGTPKPPFTEDHIRHLSESHKGKKQPLETIKKRSEKLKGRKLSEQQKEHLRLINTGSGNPNFGKKPSIETIQKRVAKIIGRIVSEETRKKISIANKGKKRTDDFKIKMSESRKGKVMSPETKEKISKANKGRHSMSEEHKQKLIEINKNRVVSEETREKIGKASKGRIVSKKTKAKISKSHKGLNTWSKGRPSVLKGRKMSSESRDKMSKSRMGYKPTEEAKENQKKAIKEWWRRRKQSKVLAA